MQKSTKDLKGNTIGATDGDIGKVDDFYFDDEAWTIRYLVADTGNWLLGRKVLLSPIAVGKMAFSSARINVTLTKKQVEESPSIDTDKPVSRQHEAYYHDYYGYPYYWTGLICGARCTIRGSRSPIKKQLTNGAQSEKKRGICICAALLT